MSDPTEQATFEHMMALEPHGADTYVGVGPRYPWGGLYGGQIVAQALRAAGLTVEPEFLPHSLHAYFIRPGDHTEPIRFEVDRIRNGRSFVTRRVVARQSIGAIFNLAASFHVVEDEERLGAFSSLAERLHRIKLVLRRRHTGRHELEVQAAACGAT